MIRIHAERVRQIRLERGLTLKDVDDAIGVDKRTLATWESGDAQDAWLVKFARLARFYGVDLMDLLEEIPDAPVPAPTPTHAQAPA